MKENWESYQLGLQKLMNLMDILIDTWSSKLHTSGDPERRLKELYNNLLTWAQNGVWELINMIVTEVSGGVSMALIMLLYILFWLLRPLPIGGKAAQLVRSYIYKKTLVSFLYGFCVTVLFAVLGVDLATLFGVVSFFLNFVPEVGAFISMILPVPVILLDGRLANPFLVLAAALVGQLVLKLLFGNILEVGLIEHDREMSIHPVWIILGLNYFGFVWGPVGMLISVPMLAMIKTAALSAQAALQEQQDHGIASASVAAFLAFLEGRSERSDSADSAAACAQEEKALRGQHLLSYDGK